MALPARTRSAVLVQTEVASAGESVVYQCPDKFIALVKTFTLHNITGEAVAVAFGVRPSTQELDYWWLVGSAPPNQVLVTEQWFVLEPLDELALQLGGGPVRLAVYGTVLRA